MNEELKKQIERLITDRFFGTAEIGFQNGVPGHIKITKVVKFSSNQPSRDNRGDSN